MENLNIDKEKSTISLSAPLTWAFVTGLILCAATIVLFIVGFFNLGAQDSLWISAACTGIATVILLAVSDHSKIGWTRMFSTLFMEVAIVALIIMATLKFIA